MSVDCKERLLYGNDENDGNIHGKAGGHRPKLLLALSFAFAISIAVNGFQLLSTLRHSHNDRISPNTRSPYADLKRETMIPLVHHTDWWSLNETASDRLWDSIQTEQGMIALPHSFADAHGLQHGAQFPWDESEGVYFLQVYHILHCLKMLHTSISEVRKGQKQSMNYWHLAHCLDSMRQDALCSVDDTPRFLKAPPNGSTGDGLIRQCRNFDEMEAWARQRTACYSFPTEGEWDDPYETRFMNCPDGSKYLPRIREYTRAFGE